MDSLAVAVVTPAGPIYEAFRGPIRANESSWPGRGADVDGDSIFRIASVSKLFASLEALILRDRGALNLWVGLSFRNEILTDEREQG